MPEQGIPLHHFVALCEGRALRGDSATAWLLAVCLALVRVQSLHPRPVCGWCPSSCCLEWVGLPPFEDCLDLLAAKIWRFLLLSQPPLVFTARGNGDLSSQCWHPGLCSPGLCGLAWAWDHSLPRCPSQHLRRSCPCRLSPGLCPSYLSR